MVHNADGSFTIPEESSDAFLIWMDKYRKERLEIYKKFVVAWNAGLPMMQHPIPLLPKEPEKPKFPELSPGAVRYLQRFREFVKEYMKDKKGLY